ncbi:hypothetical protein PVAP13_9NG064531 [Panicum virgatum]|uniref:Neprosin PEP catalytic domain-containing protein n=1 Tax=Panicum virgatum TaxID=38727 RepID=A0A8T0MBQ8_PANVG|nr:hypothetical protein PVAP13_9NG064531 [Panicum virgatum]
MGTTRGVACLLVAVICLSCAAAAAAARSPAARLHRHLKRFNKPAVKSIESPDGDIIDCVHISHQPAFDHPYLKNHTVQMRPNYHPEGLYDESKTNVASTSSGEKPKVQLWHQNGRCPEGTVPIRRTKKDDLLRASSMRRYGRKRHTTANPMSVNPTMLNEGGHQHAIAYVQGDKYYGAKVTINVWEPKIEQPNEFSLSQLWILGGSFGEDLNSIEAGWQVSPDLYGDNNTSTNNLKVPKGLGTFTEQSNCYDVQNGNNGDWGTYFYYGGPGRSSNCQ